MSSSTSDTSTVLPYTVTTRDVGDGEDAVLTVTGRSSDIHGVLKFCHGLHCIVWGKGTQRTRLCRKIASLPGLGEATATLMVEFFLPEATTHERATQHVMLSILRAELGKQGIKPYQQHALFDSIRITNGESDPAAMTADTCGSHSHPEEDIKCFTASLNGVSNKHIDIDLPTDGIPWPSTGYSAGQAERARIQQRFRHEPDFFNLGSLALDRHNLPKEFL